MIEPKPANPYPDSIRHSVLPGIDRFGRSLLDKASRFSLPRASLVRAALALQILGTSAAFSAPPSYAREKQGLTQTGEFLIPPSGRVLQIEVQHTPADPSVDTKQNPGEDCCSTGQGKTSDSAPQQNAGSAELSP